MPQPLSRVSPKASVWVGNAGDRVLSRNPSIGLLAMEAIASWSNVESFMLRLFVQLFGGDHTLAARIYLALDGRGPKAAALDTAIDSADSSVRALIRAVIKVSKGRQAERDKLAHHVWGHSPQLPDALLLLDPRETLSIAGPDRDRIYVYEARELQELVSANDRLCGYCLKLLFVLQGHAANRDGQLVAELSTEPEIQGVLERSGGPV